MVLFREDLYDARPSALLNDHRFAENYSAEALHITGTLALAKAIRDVEDLPAARIDLGKLGLEWQAEASNYTDLAAFVGDKMSHLRGAAPLNEDGRDIVLYGFGRIGRFVVPRIITSTRRGEQLRLKAIVIRPTSADRHEQTTTHASPLGPDYITHPLPAWAVGTPNG